MVEIINSLEDLCRLCAGKIDVLMGLNIFASGHRQILKKICVCLPIEISVDDGFPKMICMDCAFKLDLMFDFRERSILTAHLFSDMMTVTNESAINVDNTIQIQVTGGSNEVAPEHVFKNDFMPCKLDSINCDNELTTEVCETPNEIIMVEKNIKLDENRSFLPETKGKSRIVKRKGNHLESGLTESVPPVQDCLNKKLRDTTMPAEVFHCSENQNVNGSLTTKNPSSIVKGEVGSIMGESEASQDLNDCSELDWFFCNDCNKAFDNEEVFKTHNQEHLLLDKNTELENAKRETEESLTQNNPNKKKKAKQKKPGKIKASDKKNKSKACLECGKQYQTNYKLQEHMRKHTGEKPFLCSYEDCKKAFRSKIGLAQHEANHSGQFEFSCSTCGKGFQCKSYLVVHQRVHSDLKPFACKQCSRRFKTKQSMLDHMNRHLGVKPFLCDICGRGFITKGLCKSHQKVHSGTDNRQYPCQVCRKLFVSKSYLNTHFRIHTGEKPFMCEVCGKGFLTRVDLRIHSTMHTGEKSFVCEICGKAFARRDALRCHRRSHTGERPYKCEFCGQSFTQFSPMAIHKRLHTGERPYECDDCNKTFVSRSTMISHKKKHHATNIDSTKSQSSSSPHASSRDLLQESQFQVVAVEVQQENYNNHDERSSEQLVVIEESPQLLLALSKRHGVITQHPPEIMSLHKLKNEGSSVSVE